MARALLQPRAILFRPKAPVTAADRLSHRFPNPGKAHASRGGGNVGSCNMRGAGGILDDDDPGPFQSRDSTLSRRELTAVHEGFRFAGLSLDLTRGKPSPAQLALSDDLDAAQGPLAAADGTDVRNYGGLDGLPEARRLGAAWLGVRPDEVIAGATAASR